MKLAEKVEVVRLVGAQRVGGKDMIESVPDVVLIAPAPSYVLGMFGVAVQSPKDIAKIIGPQPVQDTQFQCMLVLISQIIGPLPPLIPPGDDLSVHLLALWCIEVAAQKTGPICRDGKRLVDAGE